MGSVAKGTPPTWDSYIPISGPGGTPPIYWWKMAETSGSTATDSADTNPGTYTGGYTLDQPGIIPNSSDPCPTFDGSTGYMQASSIAAYWSSGPLTMAIALEWAEVPGLLYGLCGLASTTTYTEMSFLVGGTGELVTGSDDGGGSFHYVNSSTSVLDGLPHLGVFTYEPAGVGGTFTGYLDGVTYGNFSLAGLTTPGGPLPTVGWATLGIGGVARYWGGKAQSLLIYDSVFAAGDVANLYSAFTA